MIIRTPPPIQLHAIVDPYCSWCYAAAPLLDIAQTIPEVKVIVHCGGMLTGNAKVAVTPEFRQFVMQHDQRVEKLTGQPFGKAYLEGLLCDNTVVLDSMPPTIAVLTAQALADKGLEMLHAQQHAHNVEGKLITDLKVLESLADSICIEKNAFMQTYKQLEGQETLQHIEQSRALLFEVGGQGFPTVAIELTPNEYEILEIGAYLGRPKEWKEFIEKVILQYGSKAHETSMQDTPVCSLDGCCDTPKAKS